MLLYDVLLELIGRWTSETITGEVIRRAGVPVDRTELEALSIIARTGGILAGELASPLRMTASNVSKVLSRMEHKRLVCRTAAEHDRRATRVALTADGARAEAALRRAGESMISALLDDWTSAEQQQLAVLLTRVLGDVRTRQFSAARSPWDPASWVSRERRA